MTERLAAIVATALLLGAPAIAQARDCATAVTQADLDACAGDAFAHADSALNVTYKTIVARLAGADATRKLLVAAQSWVGFRDQECEFEASGSIGGSIHPMIVTACKTTLTRARTEALRQQFVCGEGDLSCPLPPK